MDQKLMTRGLFLSFLAAFVLVCSKPEPDDKHTYSTWENLEIDKCASAWLIKRFVDEKAVFKFYPVGELISEGIPFDTPDAAFRRYHNLSTFESILAKHQIEDWRLKEIATAVHQLEVISWEERRIDRNELTTRLEESVRGTIESSKDPLECFEKSFLVFDKLYANMNRNDKAVD
jgi:hypothetical protein